MYTLKELKKLRTLAQEQASDLKIDTGTMRVWLARTTIEDGEPYNNKVTVEQYINDRWEIVQEYPAL